jgi:soluble lytic murein transglycosylase-like protein
MKILFLIMALSRAPADIETALNKASHETKIPIDILRAVAWEESRYNPTAKSKAGAMGLMQIMPAVAKNFNVTDPFHPIQNATAGAKLLKSYYRQNKKDWPKTFASYNFGLGNIKAGKPWPLETRRYVTNIVNNLRAFLGALY